jgi:hypothetical protein
LTSAPCPLQASCPATLAPLSAGTVGLLGAARFRHQKRPPGRFETQCGSGVMVAVAATNLRATRSGHCVPQCLHSLFPCVFATTFLEGSSDSHEDAGLGAHAVECAFSGSSHASAAATADRWCSAPHHRPPLAPSQPSQILLRWPFRRLGAQQHMRSNDSRLLGGSLREQNSPIIVCPERDLRTRSVLPGGSSIAGRFWAR